MMFLMFCCLSSSSSLRMKMISRILLLLILSSCLCATFVVNVTQSSYQAEENHSITLEWTFTTKTHTSTDSFFINCDLITDHGVLVLYHVYKGVELSEFQDEQFSGRVQSDKDVLTEGRIRLHVSRLRTEDSGLYLCDLKTNDGFGSAKCQVKVHLQSQMEKKQGLLSSVMSTKRNVKPQGTTVNPQPMVWGRIPIYILAGLTAAFPAALLVKVLLRAKLSIFNKAPIKTVDLSACFSSNICSECDCRSKFLLSLCSTRSVNQFQDLTRTPEYKLP
ncbi:uncharacterized protein LOC116733137 isoform X2 [Xiphophorus hellerii]|uniref:uncharacterized protein LOC116733137 isoform X2 n=1 Tax=Xiphophorus hellerii TaxID=8084 RepID=UPI0013B3A708|nr:uncharacterized protein LOC116733137 isoform X2 [Xiphophorus hellerii]